MKPGRNDFDLAAAWTRLSVSDLRAFVEALAVRLEAALPDVVHVDRRRDGLLSSSRHVSRIEVRAEATTLTLDVERGHLIPRRSKIVRGVTIGTSEMTMPDWLEEILHHTHARGERAGATHDALHTFLMS